MRHEVEGMIRTLHNGQTCKYVMAYCWGVPYFCHREARRTCRACGTLVCESCKRFCCEAAKASASDNG